MRDAVALRRRVKLTIPGQPETVVAGFRDSGAWSVYFGGDPVFHFDKEARLRRAFVSGALFRSEGHTLARLRRSRSGAETNLVRHDLTAAELEEFWRDGTTPLRMFEAALRDGTAQAVEEKPLGWPFRQSLEAQLAVLLQGGVRLSPRLRR